MSCEPIPFRALDATESRFHLSVCFPGRRSSISPIVQAVMEVIRDAHGASGKEFEIETALREALANAVIHGCGGDASKAVECSVSCSEAGEVLIVVRDPGPGFDPASIPSPVAGENVYSTHGRGVYLITRLMDEVWFERGGREIHMRKSCVVPAPSCHQDRAHSGGWERGSRK
jgi:serine/threonine-protein kinase RsbW